MAGIQQHVNEVGIAGIHRKQRSITRLFPDFGDKVKGVADKGGIRLVNLEPGAWHWKIHSGTQEGVWYDADLIFKDMKGQLGKHVANRRLWTVDKKHADLRKVAKKVMFSADIQVFCSCPAFLYYGPAHILSLAKYNAHARGTEPRPPKIRNPRQYGAVCKHLQTLLNVFPWYQTDMAKWLRDYYTEVIRDIEDRSSAEYGEIQRAAGELGRRQERPSRQRLEPELEPEPEVEEPVEPTEPTEPVEPEVKEPEAEAPETEKPIRRPRRRRHPRRPGEEEEPRESRGYNETRISMTSKVLDFIRQAKGEVYTDQIHQFVTNQLGYDDINDVPRGKVVNILSALVDRGEIVRKRRGIYVWYPQQRQAGDELQRIFKVLDTMNGKELRDVAKVIARGPGYGERAKRYGQMMADVFGADPEIAQDDLGDLGNRYEFGDWPEDVEERDRYFRQQLKSVARKSLKDTAWFYVVLKSLGYVN